MGLVAASADFWALFWTTLATVVLLLAPGLVYAYYVLDQWIDGDDYSRALGRRD